MHPSRLIPASPAAWASSPLRCQRTSETAWVASPSPPAEPSQQVASDGEGPDARVVFSKLRHYRCPPRCGSGHPRPSRSTRHRICLLRIPRHVAEGLATAARRWQQPGLECRDASPGSMRSTARPLVFGDSRHEQSYRAIAFLDRHDRLAGPGLDARVACRARARPEGADRQQPPRCVEQLTLGWIIG
jgi:hypothetical protein